MIKGSAWTIFILLNLIFLILATRIFSANVFTRYQYDWENNKCNPLYIPFAKDPNKQFTFCVQNIQQNYMKYLLQPVNYMIGTMGETANELNTDLTDIRNMTYYMRRQIAFIVKSIFSVLTGIVIEFQRTTVKIQSLVSRVNALTQVTGNVVKGGVNTLQGLDKKEIE